MERYFISWDHSAPLDIIHTLIKSSLEKAEEWWAQRFLIRFEILDVRYEFFTCVSSCVTFQIERIVETFAAERA